MLNWKAVTQKGKSEPTQSYKKFLGIAISIVDTPSRLWTLSNVRNINPKKADTNISEQIFVTINNTSP
jgi:hypothetical protein